jgi:ketosteroid isomerase-like protein
MKKLSMIVLLFVLGLPLAVSGQKPPSGALAPADDPGTRFAAAFNKKDAVSAANAYTQDAVLMPPNAEMFSGRDKIQAFWQQWFDGGIGAIVITPMMSYTSGNRGYEVGTFDLQTGGEKNIHVKGKFIVVLERGKDRLWRMAYDIWNADAPPATQ